ncbi:hypothetical protein N0V93_010237 [Gnomoniopsis smithogilvyi]|uniref:Uncharacterized protein n=1 Tax=Gnomoniopsis smithogilvyi TaxID=1191159 RepID=A0A9W8YJP2_9PEZI|nr:hypothetical protein N0V93_010237 [Gnomoniopsis smithogilvyi]
MIMGYKVLYTSSTTVEFTNVLQSRTSTNEHDVGGDIHISTVSDPIINYSIDHSNGNLTRIQTFAAGGVNPRQFSISKDGGMIAVSLFADESKKVTIIGRDVRTGRLTKQITELKVDGWPSCVIFRDKNT